MSEVTEIALDKILVTGRLRDVDEARAVALAHNIELQGQLQPVLVRHTPAAKRPYTLVDGAHRMRALALAKIELAKVDVLKVNKDEARLVEIDTLLMREEASALDRAIFLAERKRIYEALYPETKHGGDRKSEEAKNQDRTDAILKFTDDIADKLGLGKSAVDRAVQIAKNLHKDTVKALRGTPEANNQSRLLKLARMEPEKQAVAINIFKETQNLGDAIAQTEGTKKKVSDTEAKMAALTSAWKQAPKRVRENFVTLMRAEIEEAQKGADNV